MCIVFFDYQPDGSKPYLLILASNRDEYYHRSTVDLHFWDDFPNILAGRDVDQDPNGGTWLGISRQGRMAILTNYRVHVDHVPRLDARSRGHIVSDYLKGMGSTAYDYCSNVMKDGHQYEQFNLITGNIQPSAPTQSQLVYYSNVSNSPSLLSQGVYSLSNEQLDSPWLKQVKGREAFESIVSEADKLSKDALTDKLIEMLCDSTCYGLDPNVRDTGHNEEIMRGFNRVFVTMPNVHYGTRTNSVILVDRQGEVTFTERTRISDTAAGANDNSSWTKKTLTFNIHDNKPSSL